MNEEHDEGLEVGLILQKILLLARVRTAAAVHVAVAGDLLLGSAEGLISSVVSGGDSLRVVSVEDAVW